jgi:meiotically up-regulated gene 157 (Mug157) protein
MKSSISDQAPGAMGPIFVCATDGKNPLFADVPPGSLMKLPALGFISENDPVFVRTYEWLHSKNYKYSYSDQPYGLPGSYRLPFTTSWVMADQLSLMRGREQALKVLRTSAWDGGIVSEGVDPTSAVMDSAGRAFATAAGYVAHAICQNFCSGQ